MGTPAHAAPARAHDTHDHPDDRTFETPDQRTCVVVDGADDVAHLDVTDALNAEQLAQFLTAGRHALLELEGRARNRERVALHVAQQAREVADLYTPGQVRAHLDFAAVVGRDDLDVRVWQAAQQLLALVDDLTVARHVELHADDADDQLLDVLAMVDAGQLQQRAGTGDGPLLVDLGDPDFGRLPGAWTGSAELTQALDDLRADNLVEPHLLRTTDLGWAVVRAAHRRLRLVPGGIGA